MDQLNQFINFCLCSMLNFSTIYKMVKITVNNMVAIGLYTMLSPFYGLLPSKVSTMDGAVRGITHITTLPTVSTNTTFMSFC